MQVGAGGGGVEFLTEKKNVPGVPTKFFFSKMFLGF